MKQSNVLNSINWNHFCISVSWKLFCYDTIQIKSTRKSSLNMEVNFFKKLSFGKMENSSQDEVLMITVAAAAGIIHSTQT